MLPTIKYKYGKTHGPRFTLDLDWQFYYKTRLVKANFKTAARAGCENNAVEQRKKLFQS
jgi:hypothetical protein